MLCLTRRDELGLLILHPDIERKEVFLLNLHDPRLRGLLAGDKGSVNSIVYSSWEQLYDEGWRVD